MKHPPPHNATTWQAGRRSPDGVPSTDLMDARRPEDLIRFVNDFSTSVTYFDAMGARHAPTANDAPWREFWASDIIMLLAEICTQTPSKDFNTGVLEPSELEDLCRGSVNKILDWYAQASALAARAPEGGVEAGLVGVLSNALGYELQHAIRPELRPLTIRTPLPKIAENVFQSTTIAGIAADGLSAERIYRPQYSLLNRVIEQIMDRARDLLERALREKSDHPPQVGLMLAFLEMFAKTQADMNGIADRHLEYYYRSVLRLAPRAARPDQTTLAFELAAHASALTLPRGTQVTGRAEGQSAPVIFATDAESTLTPVSVAAHRVLRLARTSPNVGRDWVTEALAFPIANSADGFGAPLAKSDPKWPCFGVPTRSEAAQAKIGFALAASTLAVPGGARKITVKLTFATGHGWTLSSALDRFRAQLAAGTGRPVSEGSLHRALAQSLNAQLSTGAGTQFSAPFSHVTADTTQDTLDLTLNLPATAPPVAPDPTVPQAPDVPLLWLTLNPDAPVYALSLFAGAPVAGIELCVDVEAYTPTLPGAIVTSSGQADPTKAFAPFGAFATIGSFLTLDIPELRQPELTDVSVSLHWSGLPRTPEAFAAHYVGYNDDGTGPTADDFRAAFELSRPGGWFSLDAPKDDRAVFDRTPSGTQLAPVSHYRAAIPAPAQGLVPQPAHPALRLRLTQPEGGFGEARYPALQTRHAIETAAKLSRWFGFGSSKPPAPPNPPLDIKTTALTLGYSTRQLGGPEQSNGAISLLSLTPMGALVPARAGQLLDDSYAFGGAYQLGLAGVKGPQTLDLLIDIEATVADMPEPARCVWRYFDGTAWRDLAPEAVLHDATQGLTQAGIVSLALPPDIAPGSRYPGGLTWLALTVPDAALPWGALRGITPNAVRATRVLAATDPLGAPLPAGSLKKLITPVPTIAAVHQPRASSGGRAAEDTSTFRRRVSERLSHRARAIAPEDYGQLILEAFPDIGQVTVVPRDTGRLELVVSPQRLSEVQTAPLVPFWQRQEIAAWIKDRTGPEAHRIQVRNPRYEPVRVAADVTVTPDAGPTILGQVNRTVTALIAPWLTQPDAAMPVGICQLDTAALSARLAELPGIQGIYGLSVVQLYRRRPGTHGLKDTAQGPEPAARRVLKGSDPASVFVPAPQHVLGFLPDRRGLPDLEVDLDFYLAAQDRAAAYTSGALVIPRKPRRFGIGQMRIGQDFVLVNPVDATLSPHQDRSPPQRNSAFAPLFDQERSHDEAD